MMPPSDPAMMSKPASGGDMKAQLGDLNSYDSNPSEPGTSRSDMGSSGGQGDILKMLMALLMPSQPQAQPQMMGAPQAAPTMGGM